AFAFSRNRSPAVPLLRVGLAEANSPGDTIVSLPFSSVSDCKQEARGPRSKEKRKNFRDDAFSRERFTDGSLSGHLLTAAAIHADTPAHRQLQLRRGVPTRRPHRATGHERAAVARLG